MTERPEQILLLGHERESGLRFVRALALAGYAPLADSWTEFTPRAYGPRKRPALVLADIDAGGAPDFEAFCLGLRKFWGDGYPVLATAHSTKFSDIANILDAGATDFLPKNASPERIERKIAQCVRRGAAPAGPVAPELREEIPPSILALFLGGESPVRLGDIADIYPGAAPRRPWCRRMAPPDASWRGVVGADAVDRFFVGRPGGYLLWSKLHLFRLPDPREYAVPEKVLLSRIGPPIAAAVDRSRTPAGGDVYSIVPREGVSASFIACVLNSRLLDLYYNRLAPTSGGRLRLETLRDTPFPRPTELAVQEMNKIAALLAHFGPSPRNWIDRQSKDELLRQLDESVFSAFGAGSGARESLAALHF